LTSREIVDTERPRRAAIEVSVSFFARPREISSRSASERRSFERGVLDRGLTPPDSFNQ
jgi:hypothetical protein